MSDQTIKSGHRWAGVREAAAYAACGKSKFWAMINRGDVLAVRNGRKVVVCLNSIDALYRGLPRVGAKALTAEILGFDDASDKAALQTTDAALPDFRLTPADLANMALADAGEPADESAPRPEQDIPADAPKRTTVTAVVD